MTAESNMLESVYRKRFSDADRAAKSRIWRVLVRSFFQKGIRPSDVVLDLGCGYGEFLNHVQCARRIGIDMNPAAAQALASGTDFRRVDAADLSFLDDGAVDVVFTSNFLEHLDGKEHVECVVREAYRVLRPGGLLTAMGPNLRFLPGAYWDFWDHLVPITDQSLVELLENVGFEIVRNRPRFLPYTTKSRLPQSPWLVELYVRIPAVWPLFGKQFLIQARRPVSCAAT